jgi:hypothetical protein
MISITLITVQTTVTMFGQADPKKSCPSCISQLKYGNQKPGSSCCSVSTIMHAPR